MRNKSIFVSGEMQSQGIGKILLNYAKDKRNKLLLNVYYIVNKERCICYARYTRG